MMPAGPILAAAQFTLGDAGVNWSDPRGSIGWGHPLPLWAWVLLALLAALLATWSYSRLLGPLWVRAALGVLRTLTLLWLVVLLAQPMLVISRERVEPDWLLVMLDRSASMRIRDMADPGDPSKRLSRDQTLRQTLERHAEMFSPQRLGRDRRIVWLGFDQQLRPGEVNPADPGAADGASTGLRTSIDQALARAAGQPVSGVLLLSDGRSPQSTGADMVRRIQQSGAAVYAVPLGAEATMVDLAIGQVDWPRKAFVEDVTPVTVWLDLYPDPQQLGPQDVKLKLIDTATGKVLDEAAGPALWSDPVTLRGASSNVGPARWQVVVEQSSGKEEMIRENNQRDLAIELVDTPIRVLYVEGYPRWEYRYLAALLTREKSVKSSMMLISADRQYVQEGDVPLSRLPRTRGEMSEFDVIVLGDVPAGYFSVEQLGLIRDQVATGGAGLLWLGGAAANPMSYEGTPLGGLLPMRSPARVERSPGSALGLVVKPTPLAEHLNVLRLMPVAGGDTVATATWPTDLPRLLWMQNAGDLKPTAEVLAEAYNDQGTLGPLAVRMRYGAGQSLYLASDDAWRWRYARGDFYYDQYWTQLLRMLGRSRIQQDRQRAELTVSHRRVERDQAVVVTMTLRDPLLLQRQMSRLTVEVRPAGQTGSADPVTDAVQRIELLQIPDPAEDSDEGPTQRTYRGLWQPERAGAMMLRPVDPLLEDLGLFTQVEVIAPDDELRQPAPDHARLAALAQQTGGAVVNLANFEQLETLIPNRARRIPDDIRHPLGNTYFALGVFLVLITLEWIGRKAIRLV